MVTVTANEPVINHRSRITTSLLLERVLPDGAFNLVTLRINNAANKLKTSNSLGRGDSCYGCSRLPSVEGGANPVQGKLEE